MSSRTGRLMKAIAILGRYRVLRNQVDGPNSLGSSLAQTNQYRLAIRELFDALQEMVKLPVEDKSDD